MALEVTEAQPPLSVEASMAQLAQTLDELGSLEETLAAVTHATLELVEGCASASITLRRGTGRLLRCAVRRA